MSLFPKHTDSELRAAHAALGIPLAFDQALADPIWLHVIQCKARSAQRRYRAVRRQRFAAAARC